jgi:hypothetical protein
MTSVPPVDPTSSGSPAATGDDAKVQKAFQEGLLNFMLSILQGAESDLASAINDKTSEPDAVG